jgi:hypothetical protein
MVTKILGKKEVSLLTQRQRRLVMPRGPVTKYEIESHMYKLKDELNSKPGLGESKALANEYLNKVLDKLQEFRY